MRAFLSRSERSRFTVGLEKAVTSRGIYSSPNRSSTSVASFSSASSAFIAGDVDDDGIALGGAEHHQAHDRRAADLVAVLFDLDGRIQAAGEIDELRAGPSVETRAGW